MFPSHSTVTSSGTEVNTGAITSTTVTVAVAVAELLFSSVTVKVTVFAPTFEQSNDVTSNSYVKSATSAQLSLEPLSMSAAVIVAAPLSSSSTVISCETTVGAVVSTTFIVCVPVDELPKLSVAVHNLVIVELFPTPSTTVSVYDTSTSESQLSEAVAEPVPSPVNTLLPLRETASNSTAPLLN